MLMIISCGSGVVGIGVDSTGVVGDLEKLDLLMEYLEPPKHGVQSMFMRASSMATVDPRGDLLKDARADLLLASWGEMLNEDLGDLL